MLNRSNLKEHVFDKCIFRIKLYGVVKHVKQFGFSSISLNIFHDKEECEDILWKINIENRVL